MEYPPRSVQPTKDEICPICEEAGVESSASRSREEAILCEGSCGQWLHRCYAGLSKAAFASVSKSSSKFCCPLCRLSTQEKEILRLLRDVSQSSRTN